MYIILDNDRFEDYNKKYFVLEYKRSPNSTAVDLVLEDEYGNIYRRTESVNSITIESQSDD